MNKLVLSIDTAAPYTAEEIEDLKATFAEFIIEQIGDEDAEADSVDVVFTENAEDKSNDDVVRERAIELLTKGSIIVTNLTILDGDENELHEVSDVVIEL